MQKNLFERSELARPVCPPDEDPDLGVNTATPIRPLTDEAIALARQLIDDARIGSLGVTDPETDLPLVTRVAVTASKAGAPVVLLSEISRHTRALHAAPKAGLLLGEPGAKGDPLVHPRLSLEGKAQFIPRSDAQHNDLANRMVAKQPKAELYLGLPDFCFAIIEVECAFLNAGFGQAYALTAGDLFGV